MSLYNTLFGYSPAVLIILPMLGRTPDEYPRFRDCFLNPSNEIEVYTRVGSYNQNCGYGEEKLYEDENYLRFYDDDFDATYGTYVFKVPDKWKKDFEYILDSKFDKVSQEYIDVVKEMFPTKVDDIDSFFGGKR